VSEPRDDAGPAAPSPAPEPGDTAPITPRSRSPVAAFAAAGAAALLLVAAVATAPFWASGLPWGPQTRLEEAGLAARIDRLAATVRQSSQQARRDSAEAQAAVGQLGKRIGALEAKPAPAPAPAPPDLSVIREQIARLSSTVASLDTRLSALDKAISSRAAAGNDAALVMALLQLREAIAAGRPFTAQYEALKALARDRPEIVAAAAPLAEPAKTGVPTRAALAEGLRALRAQRRERGGDAAGWTVAAWSRLRGLVTIRRVDDNAGAPANGSDKPLDKAERSLADGDLANAITMLGELSGAAAEAARPWLRKARERLVVEAALQRIEAQLLTQLGGAAPASGPRN